MGTTMNKEFIDNVLADKTDELYEQAKRDAEKIEPRLVKEEPEEYPLDEETEISKKSYLNALETYGIVEEDAVVLLEILMKYRKDKIITDDIYFKLPNEAKSLINGFMMNINPDTGKKVTKRQAIKFLLENFINDANFSQAIDEYETDMNDVMNSTNTEINKIVTGEIDKMFSKIKEYKTEDPELADKLIHIKSVFEEAATFKRQLDYLKKYGTKRLRKRSNRYASECFYFNKKVNVTEVKIPDIAELPQIIEFHTYGEYDPKDIAVFVILLIETTTHMELNLENESYINVWYLYKLIEQIYSLKFKIGIDMKDNQEYNNLVINMCKVLDKIKEV